MRLVLAGLVLGACGGATQVAVENRGGAASASCDLPARLDFEGRRYANVDAGDPAYHTWSAWRVGIQFSANEPVVDAPRSERDVRGTMAMVGDELTWTFDIAGTLDTRRCRVEVHARTHEPIVVTIDLRARSGRISSIDDAWLLGPPFPVTRR